MKYSAKLPLAYLACCAALCLAAPLTQGAGRLEQGFNQPPDSTKPWCYWYWISDNITREGITKDLEAMARVGIGEALVGNIYLPETKPGPVKVLSDSWWGMVEHAIREGGRVGVNIGLFNCPGWSQSGGPWIQPGQSMRYLVSSETRVAGPVKFSGKLPAPEEPFQTVAVLAFPAPSQDQVSATARVAGITTDPVTGEAGKLIDGDFATTVTFPAAAGKAGARFTLDLDLTNAFTARSLMVYPAASEFVADCVLEAMNEQGVFHEVRSFQVDRHNKSIGVGPMTMGPVAVSFAPDTARRFRLSLKVTSGQGALSEVVLSSAARLERFVEKQLGKMHQTPSPQWDTYLWDPQTEIDDPALAVPLDKVRNLTAITAADGTLDWDVPAGDWIILRTGMTPTGTRNAPASPEGQGLEVDKMNRAAARAHFNTFIGEILRRMPARDRKAFTRVIADSYEMGPQNWTDGLAPDFQKRYGYDPLPWLPVLTGRLVVSADKSERFLWDLRRLVADRIATEYVGGLREAAEEQGLKLWLENYGHWGFPAEFLQYGSQSDRIGGEFWVTGLGEIECRAASSCANTYGKPIVSAEAFTGGPAFQSTPGSLKARGDWAFSHGINHFVLHVYIHQPWADRRPGINAWFGTEFNRHNTWFEQSRSWVDYLRRSAWLLQQGNRVADVAYFIGEDAPKMTGARNPELPQGYDYDYINADVIERNLTVKDGQLVLPHGTRYRLLVLPDQQTMRPEVLRRICDLVKAGATVLGRPPAHSPSLENHPQCDQQVEKFARDLWGDALAGQSGSGERSFGKGKIVWGRKLPEVFSQLKLQPDFTSTAPLRFTHRRSGNEHIYFVANPRAEQASVVASFRISGQRPELWCPDRGRITQAGAWHETEGITRVPLELSPNGSVFVIFRETARAADRQVVAVRLDGQPLLNLSAPARSPFADANDPAASPGSFTLAFWARPAADTTLLPEQNEGVHGLQEQRNDVLMAAFGGGFGAEDRHAGAGLAVGRNGVAVFEHTANYFAPILVHRTELSGWTHVALVYREGRPRLYLNGVLAREGLQSRYLVHPSPASGGGTSFLGKLGGLNQLDRSLEAPEIMELYKSMPRPGDEVFAAALWERGPGGELLANIMKPGAYEVETANGAKQTVSVTSLAAPMELSGPWDVAFSPAVGLPSRQTFEELQDWTQHPSEQIKHFSGAATYRKTFQAPPVRKGQSVFLDLGEMRDLAAIRLNGQLLGNLWSAPWRVELTPALRLGANELEIEVVNPWNNRLVGDAALPEEQRVSSLTVSVVKKQSALIPAGLPGPVRLLVSEKVLVKEAR